MRTQIFIAAVAALLPTYSCWQAGAGPSGDSAAIHHLLGEYATAVDTVDLKLLAQIWSHSPEVSFIYPLGEEHGFDAIKQHFFQNVMGAMFSARNLEVNDVKIYVNGDSAWSEFHWDFHATMRKDRSTITTHGIETQIYRKEDGAWRLVHVHYSEEGKSAP
jgi:uncharacterized protein (TIGR02246 family)